MSTSIQEITLLNAFSECFARPLKLYELNIRIISVFVASASEWMRDGMEMRGEVIVELKSQCRPSQSRKESILNCFLKGK